MRDKGRSWMTARMKKRTANTRTIRRKGDMAEAMPPESAALFPIEDGDSWKHVLERAGDGVWDWNVPTGEVIFSRLWKEMIGYSEDEIPNHFKEWKKRVHPDDLRGAMKIAETCLSGKAPTYLNEFRMRCKDGSWKWILARGTVTRRDAKGAPLRMVGTHTDISAQKAARERETRSLQLIATGAPLRAVLDAIARSVEASHPGMLCSVMLLQADGLHLSLSAAPGLPAAYRRAIDGIAIGPAAGSCGTAVFSGRRVISGDIQRDPRWKGVKKIAARSKLAACWSEPVKSGTGQVLGTLACYHRHPHQPLAAEISTVSAAAQLIAVAVEREKGESTLRESQQRLKLALDASSAGTWSWDVSSNVVTWDERSRELYGLAPGAPVSFDVWVERVHPDDRERLLRRVRLLMRCGAGDDWNEEFRVLHPGKGVRWMAGLGRVERDARGRMIRFSGINIDITARKTAENSLRESEERLRLALAGAKQGLWDLDVKTGKALVSPEYAVMLGYNPATFVETNARWIKRLHPEDLDRVSANYQDYVKGKIPEYKVEFRQRTKTGGWKWILSLGTVVRRDARGRPLRMMGTHTDITEQKNAEAAVHESKERYRTLVESLPQLIWTCLPEGPCDYLSPQWVEYTGVTLERQLGYGWAKQLHPDDTARATESWQRSVSAGCAFDVEFRIRRHDGVFRWFRTRALPQRDLDGRIVKWFGTNTDIDDQKSADDAYRRELEFNRALVTHTSALILVTDAEGRIVHLNPAAEKLFDLKLAEIKGRSVWLGGVLDKQEIETSKERFERLRSGKDNPPVEVRMRNKKGDVHIIELWGTSSRKADGSVDRIIVTGADVTERRRLEMEVLRISEQEQARIGYDLHDGIGQTLTGITSLVDALVGGLDGDAKKDAQRIHQLVRQVVIDVRRMSHGLSPLAVRNRGLGGALFLLAETVRGNHRTRCDIEVDEKINPGGAEKETHLFRIAQEAVNNALRHGKPSRISICLKREDNDTCVLRISNDGKGIENVAGTSEGIGIRVMDYRARHLGGHLQIRPRPRGGVIVSCRFPCSTHETKDRKSSDK